MVALFLCHIVVKDDDIKGNGPVEEVSQAPKGVSYGRVNWSTDHWGRTTAEDLLRGDTGFTGICACIRCETARVGFRQFGTVAAETFGLIESLVRGGDQIAMLGFRAGHHRRDA